MTREPDKYVWESNYNNKSISGIEVRNENGKVVDFITILHDEILDLDGPHRITIRMDEHSEPILPPPQTFEEIIQAKRRQQMLLYGSGATTSLSSTGTTSISNGTARRAAAATRRAVANLNRRPITTNLSRRTAATTRRGGVASRRTVKARRSKSSKNKLATIRVISEDLEDLKTIPSSSEVLPETQGLPAKVPNQTKIEVHAPIIKEQCISADPSPSTSKQVVTSMRDLTKHNPLLKSIDPKEVKQLLKSAPPGASIVLPNGAMITKSRRGGARIGAGRKRSRPLPPGQGNLTCNSSSTATNISNSNNNSRTLSSNDGSFS